MGNGGSIKTYNCPNNYDNNKFLQIVKLFEKIDKNKNDILELNEIKEISCKDINNKIIILEKELDNEKRNLDNEIKRLNDKMNEKITELKKQKLNKEKTIKKKLEKYRNMNDEEKCKALIEKISFDKKEIDFWKFYTYMKDKTNEINNL